MRQLNWRRLLSAVASERSAINRLLEQRFSVARAVSVSRGALGLSTVLRCWAGASRARRVAVPAAVCHDVIVAVREAGCTPVFCDVDVLTGLVDRSEWVRAYSLGATAAIVVHLYGNPADVREVKSVFVGPGCLVIDDAAQALGSRTQSGLAGGQGDVGLLSFGATKQIDAGGAALLFRNLHFACEVERALRDVVPHSESDIASLQQRFRLRFEEARAQLREHGAVAARGFCGLLDGYGPTLQIAFPAGAEAVVLEDLRRYPALVEQRLAKVEAWLSQLSGTGLQPIGMGANAVPWRFTCRLPGIDWATQHRLGEAMRDQGMHVSHWYLPAHWMQSIEPERLSGAETLSREVFQFWVDEKTSLEAVFRQGAIVADVVGKHA